MRGEDIVVEVFELDALVTKAGVVGRGTKVDVRKERKGGKRQGYVGLQQKGL